MVLVNHVQCRVPSHFNNHRRQNERQHIETYQTQNECQSEQYIQCVCVYSLLRVMCAVGEWRGEQKPNNFGKTWVRESGNQGGTRQEVLVWCSCSFDFFTIALGATICQWWGPQEERNGGPSNTITRRCTVRYNNNNRSPGLCDSRKISQSIGGNKKNGRRYIGSNVLLRSSRLLPLSFSFSL